MLTAVGYWVTGLYGFIAVDVALYEAYGWAWDAVLARHVHRAHAGQGYCDANPDWAPRWANGVAAGVAGSLLTVALWPVTVTSDVLDWLTARRARWAARRASASERERKSE